MIKTKLRKLITNTFLFAMGLIFFINCNQQKITTPLVKLSDGKTLNG